MKTSTTHVRCLTNALSACLVLLALMFVMPNIAAAKEFPDVPKDHWAYEVISRAADEGIIHGYPDGRFGPNDNITRGQVATVLWNLAGGPAPKNAKDFSDVDPNAYYAKAIAWASGVGVVSGSGGEYRPNENVTRQQLACMLTNYAE